MSRLNVMTRAWNKLSLTHRSEIPLAFRGRIYPTMYHCLYANIFPSQHDEIVRSTLSALKDRKLSLEKFEVSESEAHDILMEIIDVKYKDDYSFSSTLRKTKDRKIMNYDYSDYYFGHPRNVYGKALMKYRETMSVVPKSKGEHD